VWFATALGVYWQWFDYVPGNPLGGPAMEMVSHVRTPEVSAGDELVVEYRYQVFRDCRRDIELWLDNHSRVLLRTHNGSTSGRGPGSYRLFVSIPIPSATDAGPAVLRSRGQFWCNPINPWRYSHETPFLVSAPR